MSIFWYFFGGVYTSTYQCEIDETRFFVQMAMTFDQTSLYTKWTYQLYQYSDHLDWDIDQEKHDMMTKEAWSLRNQHALQSDVLVKQPVRDQHYLGDGFKHFYFPPYLGKWSNLTNIFQMGWNHHPDYDLSIFFQIVHTEKSEPLPPLLPDDWSMKVSPSRSNCSFVGFPPPILFYLKWIWSKWHCSPECVGRWNHFESSIYTIINSLSLSLLTSGSLCFCKGCFNQPPRLQPLCQALHHDPRAKCLCQQIGLHPHRRCGPVNGWRGEVWGSIEIKAFPIPFYLDMVFSWTWLGDV